MLIHKGYQGSHFDYLGYSSVKLNVLKTQMYIGIILEIPWPSDMKNYLLMN